MSEEAKTGLIIEVLCKELQDLKWKVEYQERRINELETENKKLKQEKESW